MIKGMEELSMYKGLKLKQRDLIKATIYTAPPR